MTPEALAYCEKQTKRIAELEQQVAALTEYNKTRTDELIAAGKQVAALQSQMYADRKQALVWRDRVAELTKERDGAIDWMQARMNEQLAASQAREAKLRWALADDSFAITFQSMGQYRSALLKLALPTDDSALQERLKEERERCAKLIENYDTCGDNTQAWQDRFAEAIRSMT